LQRDWARAEHRHEVTEIVKERCCGYSPGAESAAMKVYDAPASRKHRQNQRAVKRKEINA
jgi:hypothetical protein